MTTPLVSETAASVGALVRSRRLAGGLSQKELGELAGVGTRFVSELERGKTTLRLDAVVKVLAVFNRTLGVCGIAHREVEA